MGQHNFPVIFFGVTLVKLLNENFLSYVLLITFERWPIVSSCSILSCCFGCFWWLLLVLVVMAVLVLVLVRVVLLVVLLVVVVVAAVVILFLLLCLNLTFFFLMLLLLLLLLLVLVLLLVGGWWLVVGGWWLVVGGWWLVVGVVVVAVDLGTVGVVVLGPCCSCCYCCWRWFCSGHRLLMPSRRFFNKMPAKNTKKTTTMLKHCGPRHHSICVYVLHWDDEKRLPAVRLKTSLIRSRSYITWPGK